MFDTETTGLDSHTDRICELGFVLTDWRVIYGQLHSYVDPEIIFDNAYNSLNSKAVAGYPTFAQLLPWTYMLLLYADEYVAHNWLFDRGFLREELARCNLRLPRRDVYDTMKHSGGRKLSEACAKAGVYTDDITWHSALGDAVACVRLAKTLRGSDPEREREGEGSISLVPRW